MSSLNRQAVGERLSTYRGELSEAVEHLPIDQITELVSLISEARNEKRTVYLLGNGGSASTASHFACDLGKGTIDDIQPRVRAIALTDNIPSITAWANDSAYSKIFSEQLENLLRPGDIVIGISASGNSPNVLEAVKLAKETGAHTVALVGKSGGLVEALVDLCIKVPTTVTQQIEDLHVVIHHMVTIGLRDFKSSD